MKQQRQRRRAFEEATGIAGTASGGAADGEDSSSRRTDSSGSSRPGAPQRKTRQHRAASADDASSGPGVSKNWAEVQVIQCIRSIQICSFRVDELGCSESNQTILFPFLSLHLLSHEYPYSGSLFLL